MIEKTCCFIGHGNILVNQRSRIVEKLEKELIQQVEKGYMYHKNQFDM